MSFARVARVGRLDAHACPCHFAGRPRAYSKSLYSITTISVRTRKSLASYVPMFLAGRFHHMLAVSVAHGSCILGTFQRHLPVLVCFLVPPIITFNFFRDIA